jgi:glycosyltransferase involved in cell wall biosynthesis
MTKADAPLRIAQISPLWTRIPPTTYGGIELLLKLLIDELTIRGHDVTLFASGDCATTARLRAVCDANICELLARGDAYMFEYYANAVMTEVLRAAGELSPTPVLWTMHTSLHRDDDWAIGHYPEVHVSGISHDQLHGRALRLGRDFPVVYNGCDFDAYEPSYEPGEYLVFLGRMSHGKNPRDAIRIAQAVDMPIVLAGRPQNGQEEEYFAEEVKPLIDGKNVRWIGPVNHPQKNELLRRAAALLFPVQWDEPFGLVMIEAMACGTPVIAHRRGSVAEVVDNGVTGFHTGVIDAMAEMVPRALALDRRAIREHAQKRFGYRAMVDRYVELYRQIVADKQRAR